MEIVSQIYETRSLGRYMPLLLAPAEGFGALQALLGAFGPLLSSSIQKYTLRKFVIFKSKLCVTKVVKMKTLCAKVVVPGPQNYVLLTIFIYVEKQRLQSNFSEASIELKKISKFFQLYFWPPGRQFLKILKQQIESLCQDASIDIFKSEICP